MTLGLSLPALGQDASSSDPSIVGKLTHPAGGPPVAGITVTVAETGATATVDAQGNYTFPSLPPGTYTLVASGNGYSSLKITGVVVANGKTESLAEEMPLNASGGALTVGAPSGGPNAEGIQELASFFVTTAPMKAFENGSNLDIPRTSNDVQPYTIINREAIDQSDYTSLSMFLQNELTQNTTNQQFNQGAGGNAGNSNPPTAGGHTAGIGTVNLRGLGPTQTLLLVDGARIASQSFGGAEIPSNLDQIPLSAIDHIEVLHGSGSAIYGSSAVGGVINIVLKKNYTGGEIDLGYGNYFNTDAPHRTVGMNYGFSIGSKTHVSLMAGYDVAKSPVLQNETYLIDRIHRVEQNNPAILEGSGVFTLGATPSIVLDTAAVNGFTDVNTKTLTLKNGTSLNALSTYIPAGTSPTTDVNTLNAGLIANAGTQNFNNLSPSVYNGLNQIMLPFPRNSSFAASIDHQFSDRIETFLDFGINQMRLVTLWSGGDGTNTAGVNEAITVPGNAPNNPFQENVFISQPWGQAQGMRIINTNLVKYGVAGLLLHLPNNWEGVMEYSLNKANYENLYQQLWLNNTAATNVMIGSAYQLIYSGVYNPFVDTVAYPQNLNSYIGTNYEWFPSQLGDFNMRASGPTFSLPGGPVKATVGFEDRGTFLEQGTFIFQQPALPANPPVPAFNALRDIYPGGASLVKSVYLEAEAPIVAEKNHVPLIDSLDAQIAGRTEFFNTSTDASYTPTVPPQKRIWAKYTSSNPTYGLKWNPTKTVAFRASYAAGFVPPNPSQLIPNAAAVPTTSTTIIFDPKTNTSYTNFQTLALGGNPDLLPQTSKSYNLGVIWTPEWGPLKGLRFNLEFYKIREFNLIQSISVQSIINTPGLQNEVVRDPTTGLITEVITQPHNIAQEYTDGWDASIDYRRPTSIGVFSLHTSATLIEHLKEPPAPGDPLVEYVEYVNETGPNKLKANATLTWLLGKNWTFGWNTLYYDHYKQQGAPGDPEYGGATSYTPITTYLLAQGGNWIPSQMYHNVFASYRFAENGGFWHALDHTTIQVGINDVFNRAPPFDAYQGTPNGTAGLGIFYYSNYGNPLLRNYVVKIKKQF